MFYFIYRVFSWLPSHLALILWASLRRLFGISAMSSFSRAVLLIIYFPCSFLSCFSYISVLSKGTQLIEGMYILKGHLLDWLTEHSVCLTLGEAKNLVVVHPWGWMPQLSQSGAKGLEDSWRVAGLQSALAFQRSQFCYWRRSAVALV